MVANGERGSSIFAEVCIPLWTQIPFCTFGAYKRLITGAQKLVCKVCVRMAHSYSSDVQTFSAVWGVKGLPCSVRPGPTQCMGRDPVSTQDPARAHIGAKKGVDPGDLHARIGMSVTHNSVRQRVTKQQLTIFTGQVCRGAERQCAARGADSRCDCSCTVSTLNGAAPDKTNAHFPMVDEDTHLTHAEHTVVLLPNAAFPGGRAAQGQGPPDRRRGVRRRGGTI